MHRKTIRIVSSILVILCIVLSVVVYIRSRAAKDVRERNPPSKSELSQRNPTSQTHPSKTSTEQTKTTPSVKRVLIVGASVAEGWDDKAGGGYLLRAFQSLSKQTHVPYRVYNQSTSGAGCVQISAKYPGWLNTVKPHIVVISWGALDDLHEGTPMSTVQSQVKWEIEQALAHHAVVMLVTPPITRASYVGAYARTEPIYVRHEIAAAQSIQSRNVYIYDVFHQMKAYLSKHHQSYEPYMGDGWHPNTRGHILAGELLVRNIQQSFGDKPIVFR